MKHTIVICTILLLLACISCNKYNYKFSSTSSGTFLEGFSSDYIVVSESDGMIRIPFYLHHKTIENLNITLESGGSGIGAKEGVDFDLYNITVSEIRPSLLKYEIELIIKNNYIPQPDRFFQLVVRGDFSKSNFKNSIVVFIKDDDHNFSKSHLTEFTFLNSVRIDNSKKLNYISYYNNFLYSLSGDNILSKISLQKKSNINADVVEYLQVSESGNATGLICEQGFIFLTIDNGYRTRGEVIVLNEDLKILDRQEVGFSPKNPIFSQNGASLVIPCKGYPAPDYSVDPLGSIAVIEFNKVTGKFNNFHLITFERSNLSRNKLIRNGIRIKGPFASIAQDLEPQSAQFYGDDKIIVNFQENNGFGIIDLTTKELDTLFSYRTINHAEPGSGFDAQLNVSQPLIINWPIYSLLQPSDIQLCQLQGEEYIITANSGKPRQYDLYNETIKFSDLNPRASEEDLIKLMEFNTDLMLGELVISNADGDSDKDGYIDRVVKFGSRSISIFNVKTGERVWDSGEQIERKISTDSKWKSIFNADYNSNKPKSSSSFLGVQPSKVLCRNVNNRDLAFVILENFGGVAVFDVTEPTKSQIIAFENSRYHLDLGGDLKPTDLLFIAKLDSGFEYDILVVVNSISGSLSFYKIA